MDIARLAISLGTRTKPKDTTRQLSIGHTFTHNITVLWDLHRLKATAGQD